MASRRKLVDPSAARHDPGVLEEYLESLGGELFGLRRDRARILDELRSGLEEATDEHASRGMPAPAATEAAIDDLGSPATVAAAFSGELAIRFARRVLWVLLITGPLVGVWWLLLLAPVPVPQFGALLTAIPILPLIAAAIATAMVAIATTGSLIRWLPEAAPQRALSAALVVALICILGDSTMLSLLAFRSATGMTEAVQVPLAIAAIAASAARVVGSAWIIRRCLRARAAVASAQPPRP